MCVIGIQVLFEGGSLLRIYGIPTSMSIYSSVRRFMCPNICGLLNEVKPIYIPLQVSFLAKRTISIKMHCKFGLSSRTDDLEDNIDKLASRLDYNFDLPLLLRYFSFNLSLLVGFSR